MSPGEPIAVHMMLKYENEDLIEKLAQVRAELDYARIRAEEAEVFLREYLQYENRPYVYRQRIQAMICDHFARYGKSGR